MYLIAHRGFDNHKYSENSLKAILTSLNEKYIDGVEFDVRITKDKKIVLIHDAIIDFISDGFGIVKYKNFDELNSFKYGKSNEPLSTLEQVLDSIKTNKIILIELKEFGNDFVLLVDETIKIIKKYNLNIYVSSFNYKLLNYIKDKDKNIKCGLIIGYGLNSLYLKNKFDFNIVSYHYINKIDKNKLTFIFNASKNNINDKNYLISDNCFEIANLTKK